MRDIGERQVLGFRSALQILMVTVVPTLWQLEKVAHTFSGTRVCGSCLCKMSTPLG